MALALSFALTSAVTLITPLAIAVVAPVAHIALITCVAISVAPLL